MAVVTPQFPIPLQTTSTVGLLGVPVFAMVLSVLFLGEPLTLPLAAGLCLIVGGIAAVTLARTD